MFTKLYENIKEYIKKNYKTLILLCIILFISLYPVPYYIYSGGGTISVSDRIKINDKEKEQDFHMCYVGQMKSTLLSLGLSYIFPNIDSEKIKDENYNKEEDKIINDLLLEESKSNAVITAYNMANKKISINDEEIYVTNIFKNAVTDLKVGDNIKSVNDANISSFNEFKEYISNLEYDDEVNIEVNDIKGKTKNRKAKVIDINGEKKIGVGITINYEYKTEDNINIKFKGNETGPSGGFMMSLALYDRLTESNLSENNKICGTGTISFDGKIGEIGGVKYKLIGAVKDKCDIFLVPTGDNYKEAIKVKEKNNYKIDIYEAKDFMETVKYLESIE